MVTATHVDGSAVILCYPATTAMATPPTWPNDGTGRDKLRIIEPLHLARRVAVSGAELAILLLTGVGSDYD